MPSKEIESLAERPDEPEGHRVFVCACGCGQLVRVTWAEYGAAQRKAEQARKEPGGSYPARTFYVEGHMMPATGALRCCAGYRASCKIRA